MTYYRIFWGLKSDQLDYWLAGYVDPETLVSWIMSMLEAFRYEMSETPDAARINLEKSITGVIEDHSVVNRNLVELVEFCSRHVRYLNEPADRYSAVIHYLRIVERNEQGFIKLISRNRFRRLKVHELRDVLYKKETLAFKKFDTRPNLFSRFIKMGLSVMPWRTARVKAQLWADRRETLRRKIRKSGDFPAPQIGNHQLVRLVPTSKFPPRRPSRYRRQPGKHR